MTEIEIRLVLRFRVPEKGLTVNGILQGLEEQTPVILKAILKQIFKALEERAVMRLRRKKPGRYILNGRQRNARKLITHLGPFHYRMAQMIDSQMGKTFVPLAQELDLTPYRQYQAEAMEASVGLAIHLSFRQASQEVIRIRGSGPSKSTTYRRFREISRAHGVWPAMKDIPYRFLMVDGTKVHLQGPRGIDLGKKEMRWALASLGPGHKFEPVGFWIGKEWAEIRKDLEKRLNYEKLEVLFSDGGPGIAENLLAKGMRQQRCLWHGKRDFPFILYADKIKKAEQEPFRSLFDKISVFSLTQEQLEEIDPDDIQTIRDLAENTRKGFEQLLEALDQNKYPKARVNGGFESGDLTGWNYFGDVSVATSFTLGSETIIPTEGNYLAQLVSIENSASGLWFDGMLNLDSFHVIVPSESQFSAWVRVVQSDQSEQEFTFTVYNGSIYTSTTDLGLVGFNVPADWCVTIYGVGVEDGNTIFVDNVSGLPCSSAASVPEPATMLLIGSGLLGLVGFRRKLRKR